MSELNEIKKDLSVLFQWIALNGELTECQHHKNCAVKQQEFAKAVDYREKEVKLMYKLSEISKELKEVSDKYFPQQLNQLKEK